MTLIGSSTPSYDSNGNVTNDFLHTYTWDANGRPVTIDGVGVTYDAFGDMVEQNRSGSYTEIAYAPSGEKLALMNGLTMQKGFVPLPGGSIAVYNSSGLAYYRHSDWLGSSRFSSTPSRTLYSDSAYGPFGEPYAPAGSADLSFTGMNQDTVSNLYDFPAREYGTQGRWPSPDPAGISSANPVDPQRWNRYAYVRNAPLMFSDPTGQDLDGGDGAVGDCSGDPTCVGSLGGSTSAWGDFNAAANWANAIAQGPSTVTICPGCTAKDLNVYQTITVNGNNGCDPGISWTCGMSYNQLGGGGRPVPYISGGGGGGRGGLHPACAQPNFLNKLEIPALAKLAKTFDKTVGIGLSASGGAGGGVGVAAAVSGYLAVSPNGDASFVFSGGMTMPVGAVKGAGAMFGASGLISPAENRSGLAGKSLSGGVSGGSGFAVASDVSLSSAGLSNTFTVGFGLGAKGVGKAMIFQDSIVIPVCGH